MNSSSLALAIAKKGQQLFETSTNQVIKKFNQQSNHIQKFLNQLQNFTKIAIPSQIIFNNLSNLNLDQYNKLNQQQLIYTQGREKGFETDDEIFEEELRDDKVVLITGAASGIGEFTALKYIKKGYFVVCGDINYEKLKKTTNKLNDVVFAQQTFPFEMDVRKSDDIQKMIQFAVEKWGKIDICINNAGILGPQKSLIDYTEEDFDQVMSVNCKAVFMCMKYQIQQFLQQQPRLSVYGLEYFGNIVNVAGFGGLYASPFYYGNSAAKGGVISLSRSAASEYVSKGIRINSISPAWVDTEIYEKLDEETKEKLKEKHKIGRIGTPMEMAELIYFLGSDKCPFIVGESIVAGGGINL